MPKLTYAVPTSNPFHLLTCVPKDAGDVPEVSNARTPDCIRNAPSPCPPVAAAAPLVLTPREETLLSAILQSNAPESAKVVELLLKCLVRAPSAEDRLAVVQQIEGAVAARNHDQNGLAAFCINALNAFMSRAAWGPLLAALPSWAGTSIATGQLVVGAVTGSWSNVAAVLPSLVGALPTLRDHADIELLVRELPKALREGLWDMYEYISSSDAQLRPNLSDGHLASALAVAVLLWKLQGLLPAPSQQLQGINRFLAELPNHWQRLASFSGVAGQLLQPPNTFDGILLDRVGNLSKEEKAARVQLMRALNGHSDVLPALEVTRPAPDDLAWSSTGSMPFRGGDVATPTVAASEQSPDAAHSMAGRNHVSWLGWLCGGVTALRTAYSPAVQNEWGDEEMVGMGKDAGVPLMSSTLAAPAVGTRHALSVFKKNPLALAVATGTAVTGAAVVTYLMLTHYLWPDAASLSPAELVERLAKEVVALPNGDWGTGLDVALGAMEPEARGMRSRREAVDTTPAPTRNDDAAESQLHGVVHAQLEALRDDDGLMAQMQTMRSWAVAIARDLALLPGWEWLDRLPTSEQELLVQQLHVVQGLEATLATLQDVPQSLLAEALEQHGWSGTASDIRVDLSEVTVAGVRVQQHLPLMEYCLLRATGNAFDVRLYRGSAALDERQQAQLRAFLGSSACTDLRSRVEQHGESLRPALVTALRARLVIDALSAKAQGHLGSGDQYRRGADIVLGFLNGAADVESAALTYVDTLADGSRVSLHVPNYLVLRSASTDPALRDQVVLYRADLERFQHFDSQRAFREYLDGRRAAIGLHVVGDGIDDTLVEDIIAAAPPAQRAAVRERTQDWLEGQTQFQAGKRDRQAWNAHDSFVFEFKPVTDATHSLQDWANVLVDHRQRSERQQLEINQLRWSPLGIANADAEADHARRLKEDFQTLHDHARPTLVKELVDALRVAGVSADLRDLDPDRLRLRLDGHEMSVTEWALHGWQHHGWSRPVLPTNLGDAPDAGIGLPAQRLPDDPWPSAEALRTLRLSISAGAGDAGRDAALVRHLEDEDARRALCNAFDRLASSNRLAEDYTRHLRRLAADRTAGFHTAVANQIRTHTLWMIEVAQQQGRLDPVEYAALKASHAALEPTTLRSSSLQGITLNGHEIPGVWSLRGATTRHVFVPGTRAGDQLMVEADFRRWLQRPEGEDYVYAHAALRHHADLEQMFRHRHATPGIRLDFAPTRGPRQVARMFIDARISDVDELTVSELERFTQGLVLFGSVLAAASCTLASGGSLAALCVTSTLALLARSIHEGVQLLERGDVNGAIETMGGSLVDALDVLNLASVLPLLTRLGLPLLATADDATDALRLWQRQARGFDPDGRVGTGFAVTPQSLQRSELPMLSRTLPGGGVVYEQGARAYLKQNGHFVEVRRTDDDALRLVDPGAPDDVGARVQPAEGAWRIERPAPRSGATTLRPLNSPRDVAPQKPDWVARVPGADGLSQEAIENLKSIFGARLRSPSPPADLRQVVNDLNIEERLKEIIGDGSSLGRPGDGAMMARAWFESGKLGNGKSVETYVETIGEWTRGARFGTGPVGLMVKVDDTRSLPDLQALIDAADAGVLKSNLGLPASATPAELTEGVRVELARVIAANPEQSLLTWRRWNDRSLRLPTAADNLIKHYPNLTRTEAEDIVNRATAQQKREMESWIFNAAISGTVSDMLADRARRVLRQEVVNDDLRTFGGVQELTIHLQGVLPDRRVAVRSDGNGGSVLSLTTRTSEAAEARVTFLEGKGQAMATVDAAGRRHDAWPPALFPQLSAAEQEALETPAQLRRAVLQHMKEDARAPGCALRAPSQEAAVKNAGGGARKKRSPTCEPPAGLSLTPQDIQRRDDAARALSNVHRTIGRAYLPLKEKEWELKQLQQKGMALKRQGEKLSSTEAARLRELQNFNFNTLKGVDSMNAAYYELQSLQYKGADVTLDGFPSVGTELSTKPRDWMGMKSASDEPLRRVLMPAAQAVGKPTQSGMFRDVYPLGADLFPMVGQQAVAGQASRLITLTPDDLRVTLPKSETARLLHELSDAELEQLTTSQLSPALQKLYGDASPLPGNVKTLVPGDYYMYQIRSCSESKILKGWFGAMEKSEPGLMDALRGISRGPIAAMTGTLVIMSDMDPCAQSCTRRLAELMELFPNMKVEIYFTFDDPRHRLEFFAGERLRRVIEKHRDDWEVAGHPEESMVELATALLKQPETKKWMERDMIQRPPQLPVPRLWTPLTDEAF